MKMTKEALKLFIEELVGPQIERSLQPLKEQQTRWQEQLAGLTSGSRKQDAPVLPQGTGFTRILMALSACRFDAEKAITLVKAKFQDELGEKIAIDMQKALSAGAGTAGGFIIPPSYSQEIIELLRPRSVVRKLGAITQDMPNGTLTLPKLSGGGTAQYQGENQDATKSEQTFGQLLLAYKKLICLVPLSNDLVRFSSPKADSVVRNDIIASMRQREDAGFIRDNGTAFTPKGLRFWAPAGNIIPANGTVNLANVTIDLGKLVLALKNANVAMENPGWIFAPRTEQYLMTVRDANGNFAFRAEMLTGKLWGWPYAVTTQIPTNLGGGTNESEVYLCDFNDAVIGESLGIIIEASGDAAYIESGTLVSAFSRDQLVIRAIAQHDFGMRHDASVAVLTTVLWT